MEEAQNIHTEISSQLLDQADELSSKTPQNSLEKDQKREDSEQSIFFRIWYGLRKREFAKVVIGSSGAACAGVSKPVFGFFIITIGVAYYKNDPKHRVGKYSILFSSIGFLALFAHTLQHYLFGVVGEKAMSKLRQALYSGTVLSLSSLDAVPLLHQHDKNLLKSPGM